MSIRPTPSVQRRRRIIQWQKCVLTSGPGILDIQLVDLKTSYALDNRLVYFQQSPFVLPRPSVSRFQNTTTRTLPPAKATRTHCQIGLDDSTVSVYHYVDVDAFHVHSKVAGNTSSVMSGFSPIRMRCHPPNRAYSSGYDPDGCAALRQRLLNTESLLRGVSCLSSRKT